MACSHTVSLRDFCHPNRKGSAEQGVPIPFMALRRCKCNCPDVRGDPTSDGRRRPGVFAEQATQGLQVFRERVLEHHRLRLTLRVDGDTVPETTADEFYLLLTEVNQHAVALLVQSRGTGNLERNPLRHHGDQEDRTRRCAVLLR
jgi:hypothetical protein